MKDELIALLKEAYAAGIVTSTMQEKIDTIKKKINLSDAQYQKIEDKIRVEAYVEHVRKRKQKGETFFGDLRKQYRITDEDKALLEQPAAPPTIKPALVAAPAPAKATVQSPAPEKPKQIDKPTPAPATEQNPDGKLVLVADDNESFLLLLSSITRKKGFQCVTTSSPETAIRIIMEKKPAIVLCDINFGIGKTTGMDVFKTIRERKSSVPFIIVSAFIQKEFKKHADNIGVTDYITKPIDADQVISVIQKYVQP